MRMAYEFLMRVCGSGVERIECVVCGVCDVRVDSNGRFSLVPKYVRSRSRCRVVPVPSPCCCRLAVAFLPPVQCTLLPIGLHVAHVPCVQPTTYYYY